MYKVKIKFKIYLTLLLGFTITTGLANNTLTGYVYTKNTKDPLPFANIILQGTTIGTATDFEGKFEIKNIKSGTYNIIASYSGYLSEKKQVEITGDLELEFKLEETNYDINAVVITGTRTERELKNVPILTNIVGRNQIESTGSASILDALSLSLPSINFHSGTMGASMQLAGLEGKYTVFLIDGEKISGEINGNIDYNRIKTANIERIEIVKGASGLLYGSNAIGGVVNIITKKPKQAVEATIGSRYSNFNQIDADASVGINIKKFSSKTSFSYNKTDGYDLVPYSVDSSKRRTQEAFDSKTLNQKLEYKASEKLNFEATGNYYERERFNSEGKGIHKKDYDYTYNLKSTYRINTKNTVSAAWHSDKYITKDVEEFFDDREFVDYENTSSNARVTGTFNILEKNTLNTGIEYVEDKLFSKRIEEKRKQISEIIFYTQDEYDVCSYFTAIAGIRANINSVYGFHAVPQVSGMFKLSSMKIRAGYSMGYRSPGLKELYMIFSPVPIIEIRGNSDLMPETANYFTVSAEYSKSIFNASLSVYQNNIENMIKEVQDLTDTRIWVYENIKNVSVTGIDFNLRAKLNYGFSINGSYSYVDSENETSGSQMLQTSKHNGAIMAQYKLTKKRYGLTVNLMSNYYGETPFEEMHEITGEITSKVYEPHTIFKLTTTHRLFSGALLTAGIDNIFDYVQSDNPLSLNPGRRYFVGLLVNIHRLNFNKN
ncbi:MAG: TonB-dependent receptor [Bacteroidales bacterium]|nr:TonB-dependent receptor [Bacteroidales bacterium]